MPPVSTLPKRHVILIGGFTQSAKTVTGIVTLFCEAWTAVQQHKGVLLWTPQTWHIDIPATVEMVRNSGMDAEVFIVAYSYGGEKARRLVRALSEKGITVRYLFLVDPVRRGVIPGLFAALGYFKPVRALTPIEIPPKVREVRVYNQYKHWPFGWPAFARDPSQTRVIPTLEERPHVDMDDSPIVHADVLACLEAWLNEPRP